MSVDCRSWTGCAIPGRISRRSWTATSSRMGFAGALIAEKLGVGAPTLSEHMRVLAGAGLVRAKRIKQWTMYRRDEEQIEAAKRAIADSV